MSQFPIPSDSILNDLKPEFCARPYAFLQPAWGQFHAIHSCSARSTAYRDNFQLQTKSVETIGDGYSNAALELEDRHGAERDTTVFSSEVGG